MYNEKIKWLIGGACVLASSYLIGPEVITELILQEKIDIPMGGCAICRGPKDTKDAKEGTQCPASSPAPTNPATGDNPACNSTNTVMVVYGKGSTPNEGDKEKARSTLQVACDVKGSDERQFPGGKVEPGELGYDTVTAVKSPCATPTYYICRNRNGKKIYDSMSEEDEKQYADVIKKKYPRGNPCGVYSDCKPPKKKDKNGKEIDDQFVDPTECPKPKE